MTQSTVIFELNNSVGEQNALNSGQVLWTTDKVLHELQLRKEYALCLTGHRQSC